MSVLANNDSWHSQLKKQLDYANAKGCKYALILGESEMNENKAMVKNLETGDQQLISWTEIADNLIIA